MKKGFTLIELLAVIVILAVIALISVPTVLNIIEDSKKSSAEASAKNIVRAAETYYMGLMAKNESASVIDLSKDTLVYNGDKATKGYITFDENGKAEGKMYINGYCVTHNIDNTVSSTKVGEDDCDTTIENGPYIKYKNGYELYFNPKTGLKCESATSSITGTNDTCMKWYVFLDSSYNENVKLILDHNTTGNITLNSENNIVALANIELQNDIVNWDDSVKKNARLISASEINEIAPNDNWDINNIDSGYYLQTGTTNPYQGDANNYYWLFDNTYSCITYGCKSVDNDTNGYWTSDGNNEFAWSIAFVGDIGGSAGDFGIRPVIEVSKELFK